MMKFGQAMLGALMLAITSPAAARTPTDLPMQTPLQTLNVLYTGLAGLLGPRSDAPPDWWSYLSQRTDNLHSRLLALEARDGRRTFAIDWLCQCDKPRYLRIPPILTISREGQEAVEIAVQLRLYGGESRSLRVVLVDEDGWKIDDIIDDHGYHFTEALARGIANHERGRAPLP